MGPVIDALQSLVLFFAQAVSKAGKKEQRQALERLTQHIDLCKAQLAAWTDDAADAQQKPVLQRGFQASFRPTTATIHIPNAVRFECSSQSCRDAPSKV